MKVHKFVTSKPGLYMQIFDPTSKLNSFPKQAFPENASLVCHDANNGCRSATFYCFHEFNQEKEEEETQQYQKSVKRSSIMK